MGSKCQELWEDGCEELAFGFIWPQLLSLLIFGHSHMYFAGEEEK